MRIAVVGAGYVGMVASACFAELGHEVRCTDMEQERIDQLQRGRVPIHEEHLQEVIERHNGVRLWFVPSLRRAVEGSDVIFLAVGTPQAENGEPDLSFVEGVAAELAPLLDSYKLIVEKSTVPVGTSDRIRTTLIRNGARAENFDVVSNPEFLREGTAVADFFYPDRIVIGAESERSIALLKELYAPLVDGTYSARENAIPVPAGACIPSPLVVTSAKSAELIKHASNAFLAMKISFINGVANICEAFGADIDEVCKGVGSDSRIGARFLKAGVGYGGSCFPKDLSAFLAVARRAGYDFRLLNEVKAVNEKQRDLFVEKVRTALWNLKGKRIAALGLAFKGGTDDIRESPAIGVIRQLLHEGCSVVACDPAAASRACALFAGARFEIATDAYKAAQGADALLILTDWEEFGKLDLARIRDALHYPIIIDGRNMYEPAKVVAAGITYLSIGRTQAVSAPEPIQSSVADVLDTQPWSLPRGYNLEQSLRALSGSSATVQS